MCLRISEKQNDRYFSFPRERGKFQRPVSLSFSSSSGIFKAAFISLVSSDVFPYENLEREKNFNYEKKKFLKLV